ncbi:MAG: YciI family protein [Phenylobacterium sp.]|uniref:YciI family protein n=1 Tax=Phenylobacterium sp. TaxID=1871053 RepID=UPI001A4DE63C|nr:YciI family protein [Phenylobacterium sp.]MBL8771037.1 YciI family protein [Phenylobacterium sp.]
MPLFLLTCIDKPDSLNVRMGAREAHLAYVRQRLDQVKVGGPLLDDAGDMAGSMLILDLPDLAAAEAFTRDDPYALAGLFERVEIRPFRVTVGQL